MRPDFLIYYLLIINIIAYIIMALDKKRAVKGNRRIPEKTLMKWALFGGAAGLLISSRVFRHKTKKRLFSAGVPAIIFLHILIISAAFIYL